VNKPASGDFRAIEFLFIKIPGLQEDLVERKPRHGMTAETFEKARSLVRALL
jgi:hypothetical protein